MMKRKVSAIWVVILALIAIAKEALLREDMIYNVLL